MLMGTKIYGVLVIEISPLYSSLSSFKETYPNTVDQEVREHTK